MSLSRAIINKISQATAKNKNYNCPFSKALRKYGVDNFIFTEIDKALSIKELNILKLLEEIFVNKPEIDHYPFPKVISHGETLKSGKLTISMTFCGINAIENACLYAEKKNITPTNCYNTVECIINNLKNNSILYLDWKGDNVCINEYGQISLIDFGRFKIPKQSNKHRLDKMYNKPNFEELKKALY